MKHTLFKLVGFLLNILFWISIPFLGLSLTMGRWGTGEAAADLSAILGFALAGIVTSIYMVKNWNTVVYKKTFIPVYVCACIAVSILSVVGPILVDAIFAYSSNEIYYFVLAPVMLGIINACCGIAVIKMYSSGGIQK